MKKSLLLFAIAVVLTACDDPVHDAEVAALGPEDPSVPPGPDHRPGQPCLVCHSEFSVAGTVYEDDLQTPFNGATVNLTDAVGNQTSATTNEVGNFWVLEKDWKPVFPIGTYTDDAGNTIYGVTVVGNDANNTAQMQTHIGRDGSCATCHFGSGPAADTPGPVYVTTGSP